MIRRFVLLFAFLLALLQVPLVAAPVAQPSGVSPNLGYVLHFPGTAATVGTHADFGKFWPANAGDTAGVTLGGKFFWQAWVKPLANGGYLVSDGSGGGHSLLWGFSGAPGAITGNVVSTGNSFSGNYVFRSGEWAHIAVGWDGTNIYTWVNGVCDSIDAFAGPRNSGFTGGGQNGRLYVGGSDHQNFNGDLAYMQCWDRGQDVFGSSGNQWQNAFKPHRFYSDSAKFLPCDWACDFTSGRLDDLSPGGVISYNGSSTPTRHTGRLFNAHLGLYQTDLISETTNATPLPTWIVDGTCPFKKSVGSTLPLETIPTSPGLPAGNPRVFDSFSRRNQTFAYQAVPTLGTTEGGSLGALTWNTGVAGVVAPTQPAVWGILQGRAVYLEQPQGVAWVNVGTADADIQVTRTRGSHRLGEVGIAFHVVDRSNYRYAYWIAKGSNTLRTGSMVAGNAQDPDGAQAPNYSTDGISTTWTVLRVVTSGNNYTLYIDNGAGGWNTVATLTSQTTFATGTGAGMCSAHQGFWTDALATYDNFTIY